MDWFSIILDGFIIAAQAILHIYFCTRITGKSLIVWSATIYLLVLFSLEEIATLYIFSELAIGIEILMLFGINRLA